jgi:hypothetical protein
MSMRLSERVYSLNGPIRCDIGELVGEKISQTEWRTNEGYNL